MTEAPVKVFLSYSRKDEALREELGIHLRSLELRGVIAPWHDGKIVPGSEWDDEIKAQLQAANIILLLVSPDFIASEYCHNVEIQAAIARHTDGNATVIPVILRPCIWKFPPLSNLQALPKGAKAVTLWSNRDEAFQSVAEGIQLAVQALTQQRRPLQGWAQRPQTEAIGVSQNTAPDRLRLAVTRLKQEMGLVYQGLPPLWNDRRTRRQFFRWAGLGSAGLLATIGGRAIGDRLFGPIPLPPTTAATAIPVARPQYTPPTSSSSKVAGLPLWHAAFETVQVDGRARVTQRPPRQAQFAIDLLSRGVLLELVLIPAGSFEMGSAASEEGRGSDEGPQRQVKLSAFLMGRYPVTQAQYETIMGRNPAKFKGANRPVEQVSWQEAREFCQRLSQKTGRTYRLPSQAEWEYACRAGTVTPFSFGPTLTTALANCDSDDDNPNRDQPAGQPLKQTTEVGQYAPNGFGLYDMHGNVWEWCLDSYVDSYRNAPTDGSAQTDNSSWGNRDRARYRVLRGGSWYNGPGLCRSANRIRRKLDDRNASAGFRVVCDL